MNLNESFTLSNELYYLITHVIHRLRESHFLKAIKQFQIQYSTMIEVCLIPIYIIKHV